MSLCLVLDSVRGCVCMFGPSMVVHIYLILDYINVSLKVWAALTGLAQLYDASDLATCLGKALSCTACLVLSWPDRIPDLEFYNSLCQPAVYCVEDTLRCGVPHSVKVSGCGVGRQTELSWDLS